MTAFAGCINTAQGTLETIAPTVAALRSNLSRYEGEVIRSRETSRAVAFFFDIDAWGDGLPVRDNENGFLLVCGDPAMDIFPNRQMGIDRFAMQFWLSPAEALGNTNGTFSLIAMNEDRLILAVDKFGSRPVYWARQDSHLYFASQFRVLKHVLFDRLTIDDRALSEEVYEGQPLGDRTLFREIRVLRPGYMLTAENSRVDVTSYHDWSSVGESSLSRSECESKLYEEFIEAIRRRSYDSREDAFLSGGMDSRCVVAGLLDIGRNVNTFNTSYEGSADHVIGKRMADRFATTHTSHFRDSVLSLDPSITFAHIAAWEFPRTDGRPAESGRTIWTGEGGSVGIGHVYMTEDKVAAFANSTLNQSQICDSFRSTGIRAVKNSRSAEFRKLAIASLAEEVSAIPCPRPERRLFLYYLLNDQARHEFQHYESIDETRVEFISPVFDATLMRSIIGMPTRWFLLHDFYNSWIRKFKARAAADPWQSYPGHIPGPHALPTQISDQWSGNWHSGPEKRKAYRDLVASILRRSGKYSRRILDYKVLMLAYFSLWLGSERLVYQVQAADKLSRALDIDNP